jgi:prophage regulatory protein
MEDEQPRALRILREPEVRDRTGLSASERNLLESRGQFPVRVPLGPRSVGWLEHEINAWLLGRAALRDDAEAVARLYEARLPPGARHRLRSAREREAEDAPA